MMTDRPTQTPPRGSDGWPATPPADLRLRLLDALSYAAPGPEDIWDEIKEWLDQHRVPMPSPARSRGLPGQA